MRTGEDDKHGRFQRKHIEVAKRLYELILANCMRASEKGFNLSEMLSAAISYNAIMTINGQDVRSDQDRLDVDTLVSLVVACYCQAYCSRYGAGKVVEHFVAQERNKRGSTKLGFLSLLKFCCAQLFPNVVKKTWNSFVNYLSEAKEQDDMTFLVSTSVRVVTVEEHVCIMAGYEHHAGEVVLATDDGVQYDLLDIRKVLELKYEGGKLTGTPAVSGEQPKKTPARPVASVYGNSTMITTNRGSRRQMKKFTNDVARSLSGLDKSVPLTERAASALKDFRKETVSTCGSLNLVRMVGDGRCAFYAMLHQVGIGPSVESVDALRCILWNSCPEEHRATNTNLLIKDFSDLLAWGSTDNFGLFSLIVASRLCVHVLSDQGEEVRTTAYSLCEQGETTMHVRWTTAAAGHVDSYEGVNFPRDRDVRALNFVDFLQRKIFDIKGDVAVNYDSTSVLPDHEFVNRSGLKLLSILAKFPILRTEGRVLDLCGAPGGFLSVLRAVNADVISVSGPAIAYKGNSNGTHIMDITDEEHTRRLKTESFALVVADGADENSYYDENISCFRQM